MKINKRLMKKQIITIILTILAAIATTLFFNNLIRNGLGSLFTIPAYEKAFEMTSSDIMLLNFEKWISTSFVIVCGYETLLCNKQLSRLDTEEKRILGVIEDGNKNN